MNSPTTVLSLDRPIREHARTAPSTANVYHLHPLVAGPLDTWPAAFARIAAMGFSHVCLAPPFEPGRNGDLFVHATFDRLHPALGFDGAAESGLALVARQAERAGLDVLLDIAPASVAADSTLHQNNPDWFAAAPQPLVADPRHAPRRIAVATPDFAQAAVADANGRWWSALLRRLAGAGLAGFRCLDLDRVPPFFWRQLIEGCAGSLFLAWTPGLERARLQSLAGCGFDLACSSAGWWDGRAEWFLDEHRALAAVAPALAGPEPSFLHRLAGRLPPDADIPVSYRSALHVAAATGAGLFLPMGFEYAARRPFDRAGGGPGDLQAAVRDAPIDLAAEVRAVIERSAALPAPRLLRPVTNPYDRVTALLRADSADIRDAETATLVLINPDASRPATPAIALAPLPPAAGAALTAEHVPSGGAQGNKARGDKAGMGELRPGEVRLVPCRRTRDVESPPPALRRDWAEASRIAVEDVQPSVPGGDYPAKTVVGRTVTVSADVFGDGHDVLAAALLWRYADETDWRQVPMRRAGNDRWEAPLRPERIGLCLFAVEGWWDQWGTYTHDLHAKVAAGQPVGLELREGRQIVAEALSRAGDEIKARLQSAVGASPDAEAMLSPALADAMGRADARPFAARSAQRQLRVDRPAAEFASWYELFPRSETHDPRVHGTFRSVIERLPAIRAMGFDVLYFPPINPIGTVNRKGRNNSLLAEPGDVGSPYAIGSAEGGHDAVNPLLGTLDDFRLLQREARAVGLELALDFAIQCAPDHPWITRHKDWFRWRPDGSMRYAENPPKKYEDIVNPDFYTEAAFPAVWTALRDVIQFWVDQGVRIFRIDNPHTKPLPFWQWMIADIQSRHPDVLFLSEAFTRPKLMYRLAKVGFSQSYTYFTWRNTKQEIAEYLTEITAPPVADFFRPNFFVNTPDINPVFLQSSGRAGFLIRAALATTLSGLWGMYSGFEICEAAPLPGREEYVDSEKYEVRPRDYAAPGNIVAEITALNRIRRLNPALQTHLGVRFHPARNDRVILYSKRDDGGDSLILVAVSFDPHGVQEADIELPLWQLGLPDDAPVAATELMRDESLTWYGRTQRIRLDPARMPFHIWRLSRVGAT